MVFDGRAYLLFLLSLGVGCGRSIRGETDGAGASGESSGGIAGTTSGTGGVSGSGAAATGGVSGSGAAGAGGQTNSATRLFFESDGALVSTDFSGGDLVELCPRDEDGTRYTLVGLDGERLIVYRERFASLSSGPNDSTVLSVAPDGSACDTVYSGLNSYPISPVAGGRVVLIVPPVPTTLELPPSGGPEPIIVPATGLASIRTDGTGFEVLAPSGVSGVHVAGDRVIYGYSDATLSELYTSFADGTERAALVPSSGSKSVSQVSGARLVVYVGGDVVAVDPDGGQLVELAMTPDTEYAVGLAGEHLVINRQMTSSGTGQTDLYAVPLAGGALVPLATGPQSEAFAGASGDRIVYHGDYDDVYSVKLDGSDAVPIAATADREYVLGVEGDRVFFTLSSNTYPSALVSAALDGTDVVMLAQNIGDLAAIVDDRAIVTMGGATDVFSIPVTGGTPLGLAENAEPDRVVGRLGRTLILMRGGESQDGELSRIEADGSDHTVLLPSGRYVGAITEGCGVVPGYPATGALSTCR